MLVRKASADEGRGLVVGSGWGISGTCPPGEVEAEVYSGQMATKMPTTGDTELLHFRAGKGLED